ncbi:MAG TPA: PaaX family transcriptional regulator C-terminal domain-containing protein, partial [Steroidobacteraceae bacterium]|nr:PaaX family transcriptional regulator C-terminal domain-containing protein [Steroidobacteraceae bacterium]
FGLTERLVRTSVARLALEDWLANRRIGRRSEYCLTTHGRERFREATARIYSGPPTAWSGRWTLVLMPELCAAQRELLRRQLRWKGFGEIAPGVLAHPTTAPAAVRAYLAMNGLADAPLLLETSSPSASDAGPLVARGWDLRDLAARYARFIRRYQAVAADLDESSRLAPLGAFVVRTLMIHEYRRIHLRDPLLPRQLLPDRWPGTTAYETCRRLYARVFAPAEAFLDAHGSRLDGPLPRPDRSVLRRFPRARN